LTTAQIAEVCAWVYQPPTMLRRVGEAAKSVGMALGAVALAATGGYLYSGDLAAGGFDLGGLAARTLGGLFNLILFAASIGLVLAHGLRNRGQYGLSLPSGWQWILALPAGVVAGLIGGAWAVPSSHATLWSVLAFPVLCEGLARGVVQGRLISWWNVQRPGGRWFVSAPNVAAAITSAALSSLLFLPQSVARPDGPGFWIIPAWIVGALVLGLGCGVARERSGSLIPPVAIHLVAALWGLVLPSLV
jgi:membrane protease YdiL (CAAX protease family)